MRHLAAGLIAVIGLISTVKATTVDYAVSKDPNGFNVYRIAKDGVTKLPGSPFGSSLLKYVWTDGKYIYAVDGVSTSQIAPGSYYAAKVVTYTMTDGEPKKVASVSDNELADTPCGPCSLAITSTIASPGHLFMTLVELGEGYATDAVHVYNKHSGGALKYICDIYFDINYLSYSASSITGVRVDANEIYAYIDYVDYTTQLPMTGIYDISTSACKHVGNLVQ